MAEHRLPDGGVQYRCTRAELAGVGIGPYPSDLTPVDWDQIPERRPQRQGLAKLRAALEARQQER